MSSFYIPLEDWTNYFVDNWLIPVMSGFFDQISDVLSMFIESIVNLLILIPPFILIIILVALAWFLAGKGTAIFTLIGSLYIIGVDMWVDAMETVAIVIVSTIISIIIGIPFGILSALSNPIEKIIKPILDFMQTLPSFVYLIPAILLFGLGGVPAVIATVVFSLPPTVRMTSLGIRQVPSEVVEAARAFGSTPRQLLVKIQLPLAMPAIMTGINQTIMLALSMTVVASMIGAPGLGTSVLKGISNVNIGLGLTSGLGIVVLAIVLDRITQGLGEKTKL